jgi:hypothetical protein
MYGHGVKKLVVEVKRDLREKTRLDGTNLEFGQAKLRILCTRAVYTEGAAQAIVYI